MPAGITLPPGIEFGEVMMVDGPADAAAPPKEGEGEAEKPKIDPKLLQRYSQVELDRRPSVQLETWSKPEPLLADQDPELALPEEPAKAESLPAPVALETVLDRWKRIPQLLPVRFACAKTAEPAHKAAVEAHKQALKDLKQATKEYEKKKAEIEGKRLERQVELFQRKITLGRWQEIDALFTEIGEESARPLYESILQRLQRIPNQNNSNLRQFWEKHSFGFEDILALVEIAPGGFKQEDHLRIAPLLTECLSQGHDLEEWLARLREETSKSDDEKRLTRRQAAWLLTNQGRNLEMGEFLPSLAQAIEEQDREGLNLLARYSEARADEQESAEYLKDAWEATLAALAPGEIEPEIKVEALKRAVSLARRLSDGSGDQWLVESFTSRPERGMEVIATIGGEVSKGMVDTFADPQQRLATMKLLKTAVDALLEKAPERAEEWRRPLYLLADGWLREAAHSYQYSEEDSYGPSYQRDAYGNIYWSSYSRGWRSNPVAALAPGELLDIRPDGRWRELLDDSVRPKFDTTIAELFLKVNEEVQAFPYIEQLAKTNPRKAKELAQEFLEVWIRNNDPNSSRNRADIYSYSFGYMNRASGIPLTRSKQERSLKDLAHWVQKLRSVPGIELEPSLLMRAFVGSHSYAEVYRIETMEQVFGSLETLDPDTLAQMAQTMRSNLAGVWRAAETQTNAKTGRKKADIEAEVRKGYAMAGEVLGRAMAVHPDAWQLMVARAAMMHDLNNYNNEIKKASNFAGSRQEALDLFGQAAAHYCEGVEDLRKEQYNVEPFTRWFYAALGATDVDAINQDTVLAQKEILKIRDQLEAIYGQAGEDHMSMFANNLFTHLGEVNPSVKDRYLEAGFAIVGEHPQARPARKVYDYYRDLVTEIRLVAKVDGASTVGTDAFGVLVELQFTREIEREGGGFNKYLQNQANAISSGYYYNYGRPQENYRDKFEEAVRTILNEQYEVLSVTFNKEDAKSKAMDDYGWRRLPYAYILVQARGPEVDRLPPLKIDLDFNDVTGYVVLPIASAVVPLDASVAAKERPYADLQVTQILDERKATEGVLSLEVKAQSQGLVPALDSILDVVPGDFEVTETEDKGVSVERFADDGEGALTSRLWTLTMKPKADVAKAVAFAFGTPRQEGVQDLHQRYNDADLEVVEGSAHLVGAYEGGQANWWVPWLVLGGLVLFAGLLWFVLSPKAPEPVAAKMALPNTLTPFTVVGYLRQIQRNNHLAEHQKVELDATVSRIERYYFDEQRNGNQPDLAAIAKEWQKRA
ncbi:MAG: hypothetical protein R3F17_06035 [Planctomycetota bacterium]